MLWLAGSFGFSVARAEDRSDLVKNTRYLALGDSLAFGFNPTVTPLGDLNQYHGYPQAVSRALHLKLANASCFGETTGHFLNHTAPDLGCQWWRGNYPLFVNYSGTQMQYTLDYLSKAPKTELVTIDIGVNDLGVLLQGCAGDLTCAANGLNAVVTAYAQNVSTIITSIRTEYTGPIVAVTSYAFDYNDPVVTPVIALLNSILSSVTLAAGGRVADAFLGFQTAAAVSPFGGSSCAAGLLVQTAPGVCDTHPSAAGQALIAELVIAQAARK